MATTETSTRNTGKGAYRGYMLYGNILELWFSSPTGDETDTIQLTMQCTSNEQAKEIAAMHQRMWGLD